VAVAGERRQPPQPVVGEQPGCGRRLGVEAEHADEPVLARRRPGPPRPAVAPAVAGCGGVHLGGDGGHLTLAEHAGHVQHTGPLQLVAQGGRRVARAERARGPDGPGQAAAGDVGRHAVERGPQQDPPVEQVADRRRARATAGPGFGGPAPQPGHRRGPVVDQVGELGRRQLEVGRRVAADGRPADEPAPVPPPATRLPGQDPPAAVARHDQWPGREPPGCGVEQPPGRGGGRGQVVAEQGDGVDGLGRPVDTGAEVDAQPRPPPSSPSGAGSPVSHGPGRFEIESGQSNE
jgi:hypothetical protein